MGVALVKAALVVGFFMHLHYENRFLAFVFLSSLACLLIFFVLTFADIGTRGDVLAIQDNFALKADREQAAKAEAESSPGNPPKATTEEQPTQDEKPTAAPEAEQEAKDSEPSAKPLSTQSVSAAPGAPT